METKPEATPAADAATVEQDQPEVKADATTEGDVVTVSKDEWAKVTKALADANNEAKTRRLEIEKRDREQAAAEEARLAEQGKFQELATTREQERDVKTAELEAVKADLSRANEILGKDIDARIEKWPPQIKKLVPSGEGVSALVRLEAIQNLQEAADSLMSAAPRSGNGAGPTPNGSITPEAQKEAQQAQANATRRAF